MLSTVRRRWLNSDPAGGARRQRPRHFQRAPAGAASARKCFQAAVLSIVLGYAVFTASRSLFGRDDAEPSPHPQSREEAFDPQLPPPPRSAPSRPRSAHSPPLPVPPHPQQLPRIEEAEQQQQPPCGSWEDVVRSVVANNRRERERRASGRRRPINSTMGWYCAQVRAYRARYRRERKMEPPFVVWTDYKRANLFVKLLRVRGYFDANFRGQHESPFKFPDADTWYNSSLPRPEVLPPLNVSLFLLKATTNHIRYGYAEEGLPFPCEGQLYNHVPGEEYIGRKDWLVQSLRGYERALEQSSLSSSLPRAAWENDRCFPVGGLQPETFLMNDVGDCRALFADLKAARAGGGGGKEHSIAYISKHASRHNGKALVLYTRTDMETLEHIFQGGALCGKPLIRRNYQFFPGVASKWAKAVQTMPRNLTLKGMIDACDAEAQCNAFTSTGVLLDVLSGPETFDTASADLRHGMYLKVASAREDDGVSTMSPVLPRVLIQRFLPDPLTIDGGHKFDLRVYLIIASTDPVLAFYHEGFLRVSLSKYHAAEPERASHITNTALSKAKFKKNKKLAAFQMRSMAELQEALVREGFLSDLTWVETVLEPSIKRSMIHIVKAVIPKMRKRRGFFGIYGCDFMIDASLRVWFVEANRSPAFEGTTERKGKLQRAMLNEVMELEETLVDFGIEGLLRFKLKGLQPILYVPKVSTIDAADPSTLDPTERIHRSHTCGETHFGLFEESCSAVLSRSTLWTPQ